MGIDPDHCAGLGSLISPMHQLSPVAVPLALSHPEERLFGLFFGFVLLEFLEI
jgi:hypothetical protein